MKNLILGLLVLVMLVGVAGAQTAINHDKLAQLADQWQQEWESWRGPAWEAARQATTGPYAVYNADPSMELVGVKPDGTPVVYRTENINAAITTRTNHIQMGGISGYNLNGQSLLGLYHWDNSAANPNHPEFVGRIIRPDNAPTNETHGNHTAGTMMASGVQNSARGMADNATLFSHDWNFDNSEMATAGANGALVSNHSYSSGFGTGGYSSVARDYDDVAYNAPNYLIHISAGNYGGGTDWNSIPDSNTPKNAMVVGSVNDVMNYTGPGSVVRANSSSIGPTDDGRIKPDIMANGVNLYSCSVNSYTSLSGTSMSSPNAAGSSFLLHELYNQTHGGLAWSSTIKAVVIHTADEAGPGPGPDYQYGWGLYNAHRAADLIAEDGDTNPEVIQELALANGDEHEYTINTDGVDPLRVTITWLDPPANINANPVLMHDLDIRLTELATGDVYEPWVLSPSQLGQPAETGDNDRDNVEQIFLEAPAAGSYTLTVNHKWTLTTNEQAYSLIVTGGSFGDPPVALLYLDPVANYIPWYGGNLIYDVTFAYNGDTVEPGYMYWTDVLLPNGNTYGPIFQFPFTLNPGMNAGAQLTTYVPAGAPAGDYTVQGHVGVYPNDILIEDSFLMTKFDEWTAEGEPRQGAIPWATDGEFIVNNGPEDAVEAAAPTGYALHEAYPNPFNPTTTVQVSLPASAELTVTVHNTLGQTVATLADGTMSAGTHSLVLDGANLASGVYLVRAHVPGELNATRKVVLMK